ncbi:uncharacterized protein I303_104111 [Kwoniella dejecticola CBS 10117]|uniref:ATP-grasp domain-containing protein n=1 Tax=Kwoniella dejecticola CBS 10117 TaxID=1296121 RepID=A0A1A6A693_9TREE|nr:uncharacterized protein I303_04910 [Kwoniella dejecticola CBS 10117]OBR85574.1 hypothetical protein I303_04910 [Kwoniella dejecticola CBS 10117]
MGRQTPSTLQDFLSSVILPILSLLLLPVTAGAVVICISYNKLFRGSDGDETRIGECSGQVKGCVVISGGRMSKGLTLARAFKRAGWKVIGVEEEGWGEYCPMRYSAAIDRFYILPTAAKSYERYSKKLLSIAQLHSATLFIPVSGAGSSVEDAKAAEEMFNATDGRCRTFIQDPETMEDLHDKDRFMGLVERLAMKIPSGKMVESVQEALDYLQGDEHFLQPKYILKCMGLDENRGDMTLYPLKGDNKDLTKTRISLDSLRLKVTKDCPYVFQEFIPGQEWCTHASVIDGQITSFVTCPSNDMLMTYENATGQEIAQRAERWTKTLLNRLQDDPTPSGKRRNLTGHFSFDFILSTRNGELYPIECNARVHTAVIMLPLSKIAACYEEKRSSASAQPILRPPINTAPRSWIYNDLIMRYLPRIVSSPETLARIHPSLPACAIDSQGQQSSKPSEDPFIWRKDPTLISDDWVPFIVLWHVYWPYLLLTRWWAGKKWTRLNVSTGRIFEA